MSTAVSNGLEIEYETFGEPGRPALLLVMGLGAQLVHWPGPFCQALADAGFFVIRYDNRDVGLSTKIDGPIPDVTAAIRGDTSSASYTLADMAADGIGLLGALGISSAHVVGMSMGGMITQHMAMRHPAHVLSLCSMMAAPTGMTWSEPPTPEARAALFRQAPRARNEAIEQAVDQARAFASDGYPFDAARARVTAALSYDRCVHPIGFARQFLAIVAAGDWRSELARVEVPSLVIHGESDPLMRPAWGRETARSLPRAKLLMVPGLGHDLPEGAWTDIVAAITQNAGLGGSEVNQP